MDIEILITGPAHEARNWANNLSRYDRCEPHESWLQPGDRLIVKHQAHVSTGGSGALFEHVNIPPVVIMDVSI